MKLSTETISIVIFNDFSLLAVINHLTSNQQTN